MIIKKIEAQRYQDGKFTKIIEDVVNDIELNIYHNNELLTSITTIDEELDYLAAGYLYDKGYIRDSADLINLTLNGSKAQYSSDNSKNVDNKLIIYETLDSIVNNDHYLSIIEIFNEKSEVFIKTGGVHGAMIFGETDDKVRFFKDIARHNNILRACGYILYNCDYSMPDIMVSSRVNREIVEMASRVGFKSILCRGAPSSGGIIASKKNKLVLRAFARQGRFTLF